MSNILDYIKWRGDLSFNQSEFNNVDNLIFSRFSYLPLEDLLDGLNEIVTIKEAYLRLIKQGIREEKIPEFYS